MPMRIGEKGDAAAADAARIACRDAVSAIRRAHPLAMPVEDLFAPAASEKAAS